VFRARYQGDLPRPIEFAVKQLLPPLGKSSPEWPGEALVERWNGQVKLLHLIHHDHLVGYQELFYGWPPHPGGSCSGEPPPELGTWYLTMLWVDGPNLHDVTRAGTALLEERIGYVTDLASAVAHLHSGSQTAGMTVLHRDIKPGNVIVNPERGAVLVDCGLLRVEEPELTEVPAWTGPYLAPEAHIDKTRTSKASDLWAVAATGFFAITGEHPSPFEPDRMRDQLMARLAGAVAQPGEVTDAFMAALDMAPERRTPSATAWAALLTAALGGPAQPDLLQTHPFAGNRGNFLLERHPGRPVRGAIPATASAAQAPGQANGRGRVGFLANGWAWRWPRRAVFLVAVLLVVAGAVFAITELVPGPSPSNPPPATTGLIPSSTTSPAATTTPTAPGTTSPPATAGRT